MPKYKIEYTATEYIEADNETEALEEFWDNHWEDDHPCSDRDIHVESVQEYWRGDINA